MSDFSKMWELARLVVPDQANKALGGTDPDEPQDQEASPPRVEPHKPGGSGPSAPPKR